MKYFTFHNSMVLLSFIGQTKFPINDNNNDNNNDNSNSNNNSYNNNTNNRNIYTFK